GVGVLVTKDPRGAFAAAAALFYPGGDPPTAAATIAADAAVAPTAVIGPGAVIGSGSRIGPGAVIGAGVVLGENCVIAAHVTITHSLIGNRVIIHPGVQIGQDGFGFVPSAQGPVKIPQFGRVTIGDDVEIGANTTIDRGALEDTVIGSGTKIDNLVQIGHNVE